MLGSSSRNGLPIATAEDILRELVAAHQETNAARRAGDINTAAARLRRAWKAAERHLAGTPVLAEAHVAGVVPSEGGKADA